MLKEFAGLSPDQFSDKEIEQQIIAMQSRRMKERAPGKYGPMLFVVKLIPNMETLYHFGRLADDMVDGDAPLPEGMLNPYELLRHLDEVAENYTGFVRNYSIDFMLQRSMQKLEKQSKGKDDIQGLVHAFIDGMRIEYSSRLHSTVFNQQELKALYRTSFEPAQDITLIALGTPFRSRDIPELSEIQGRSYSVNDLKDDLERGMIRIPKEIMEEAGTSAGDLIRCPECTEGNEIIQEWKLSEGIECTNLKKQLFKRDMDLKTRIFSSFMTFNVR